IETHRPASCAVESAFYGKNAQSALKLGHARGVALLAAAERSIPTAEYSPREVKKAVAGNGGARKEQVRTMVQTLLGIPRSTMALDTSDALAVALCHIHRGGTAAPARRTWKAFVEAHPERIAR
ncbi:MAG: crossover junction endodeoxyribonuclease RuvC, partial [Bacteroidetes bacterium]|nr:crossover junction endodeoxyribonuclease RuvC [Bacteroidota bacterium]